MPEVTAYVALGSNLENPAKQITDALQELGELPDTRLERASSLYGSPPMGPPDQPDYVNAVARLRTGLTPERLLDALQGIEAKHGRIRRQPWGPRTLDLDILLYGAQVLATPGLRLPHPGMADRNFVLYPLAEIESELDIPGLGRLSRLLDNCPRGRLVRLR